MQKHKIFANVSIATYALHAKQRHMSWEKTEARTTRVKTSHEQDTVQSHPNKNKHVKMHVFYSLKKYMKFYWTWNDKQQKSLNQTSNKIMFVNDMKHLGKQNQWLSMT